MRTRRAMLLITIGLPFALAGCQQDTEIASYEVKYPQRENIRMLTAVIPDAEATYFVVLKGPEAAVAQQKKPFDDFVASIRLDAKKDPPITWTAPDGWDEEKGAGERLVGFKLTVGSTKMETTLTKFPKLGNPGEPNSLLDNINRWRGLVDLPPAQDTHSLRREKVDGREVILADMTGLGVHKEPSKLKMQNPHAGGMPPVGMPKFGRPEKDRVPFIYEVPNSWAVKEPPLPGFAVAAFVASDGSRKAIVSLTPLKNADLVANVNRWRTDTLGLAAGTRAGIERDAHSLKVAGLDANYVDIVNPAKNGDNRVLGVIISTDDGAWVIRMFGPDDLVGNQKANFETFVRSFKRNDG